MHLRNAILAAVLYGSTTVLANNGHDDNNGHSDENGDGHGDGHGGNNEHKNYKHVALFSIDGLHSSDVGKYVSLRPKSTIAALLATGYEYTNAFTSAPSDSFPGSVNQFTGASPRTTGIWYDDIWDRSFYPPFSTNGTRCEGPPGAEGTFGIARK